MKNGFTLLELLIVIAIIGTLSTVMFPNFLGAQDKAKEVASLGVDFISVGSLTHSYKSLDISMDFLSQKNVG